jgi:RNA polymerase sigma-70 factor, ECF subfamily
MRKISEHFTFPGSLSIQEGSMAIESMAGESILKPAKAMDGGAAEAVAEVESLVSGHTSMVFRIAYSILRNHHDAEDAAQECFLKVLKLAKKSKAGLEQVRNAKTWLARVAWTTALDRRSRRALVAGHEFAGDDKASAWEPGTQSLEGTIADFPDTSAAPDELLAGRDMQALLQKMIAALPEDLRQTLELSTVQELNSAEIAEVMGIPEGSVRTRLMRARKLLREKLATLLEVKEHD